MRSSVTRKLCSSAVGALACALALAPHASVAAIKTAPYPEVTVELSARYQPEPEFQAFFKSLSDAVASRNTPALFALVGPMFVWTSRGALTDDFDPGRDALHNFKVVFGFRQQGKDEDGGVNNGPFWDDLTRFVSDPSFYSGSDKTSLTCGPLLAEATDAAVLEQAQDTLHIGDDFGEWFFTEVDTPVSKSPSDTGPPIGKLGKVAFPVISVHPPAAEGANAPVATHYQVLLPSGTTGWIAAAAARPLVSNRLCYAKTKDGRWTIVDFDQNEDEQQ